MNKSYKGVRKKSDSSIEIDFRYKGVRCRETLKLKPTNPNLIYAKNLKGEIENAIAKGTFSYVNYFPNSQKVKQFAKRSGDVITVEECLKRWLKWACTDKQPPIKASTLHNYNKIVFNRLIPQFGHLKLTELKLSHVQDWIRTCKCTRKTLYNLVSPLKCALDDAIYNRDIKHNILHSWKPNDRDVKKTSKYKIEPFTKAEQTLILDVLEGQNYNLILFAFWTGLRTSELVALNWEDINLKDGCVSVNKALTQVSNIPEKTKTTAGTRKVKLLAPAISALQSQRLLTKIKNDEVFQNPNSQLRWSGDQAIRKSLWIPALKEAGVKYRNPYQTRHTFASMMISVDVNIAWLAKQMGHKDPTVTAQIYASFLKSDDDTNGEKAVALFFNNKKQ